jgi:5-methylthioadenosine/S-adenosylhomocysteine deaminase
MKAPGEVLEDHTVLVRDGRIIAVAPTATVREHFSATVELQRPRHVVLPGLVNAAAPLLGGPAPPLEDRAMLRIAELLAGGTTCVCSAGIHPAESARWAVAQGLRAVIGLPIAELPTHWAGTAGEYLTRALALRDEYVGHPLISTAFAPLPATVLTDATLQRVATLAAELDAAVVMTLHESAAAVTESVRLHGLRPLERLETLGLLTPTLTAVGLCSVDARDIALAERGGIAIALCPTASALGGDGPAPLTAWRATPLRLALGSGHDEAGASLDLWSEVRRFAVDGSGAAPLAERAWKALRAVTSGAAAALGLDADIGSVTVGKWADLCCVDLHSPALLRGSLRSAAVNGAAAHARMTELVFDGGRDSVSDVWVAGRHLVNEGAFTRLDWSTVAARLGSEFRRTIGDAR